VQIRTIDALLSQLCIHHIQVMLTTDRDVARVARHSPLKVWKF
jgi:predicted nucleic acid-binding protein